MKLNAKYKSTVFTALFSDKANLLELYNAIKGSNYDDATKITIKTLRDIFFMDKINDIAFILDNTLILLIEHQSTINLNMPLRFLLYMARLYEKVVSPKTIYRENRIKIPKPQFIVLYNGAKDIPDEEVLKLSDAFKDLEDGENPMLDLTVTVYNVNQGHNEEILKKSENLRGYARLVSLMREAVKKLPRKEAVKEVIRYCINNQILSKFIAEHASEVENMLLTEWNWNDAKEVWQEEADQRGYERGQEETQQKAARKFKEMGMPVEQIAAGMGLSVEEIEKA
jgi:predicted transposase/invertase (TIGR01784 family)